MQLLQLLLFLIGKLLRHRNIHIRKNFREAVPHDAGREFCIRLVIRIRPVHDDIDQNLGIIDGRKAHEGDNILPHVSRDGLSRAGLAADHISSRTGRVARAVRTGNDLLAVGSDPGAGILRNRLLDHVRFDCPDRGTGRTGDLAHDMRLIIITAVDERAETRGHLNHRHVKILPERIGGEIRDPHLVRRVNHAVRAGLIGQIDVGLEPESKDVLEFAEGLLANGKRFLHQSDVAGTLDRLSHRKDAVTVGIVALDRCSPLCHGQTSLAQIGLCRGERTALEPGRCRERFCRGTGLIIIGYAVILPERIQIFCLLLIREGIHILLRQIFVLHRLIVVIKIQLRHTDERSRIIRIIQIEARVARHGEHAAGIRIHDDDADIARTVAAARLVLVFIVEFLEILFADCLNIGIQRQLQIVPV